LPAYIVRAKHEGVRENLLRSYRAHGTSEERLKQIIEGRNSDV
jgi:hypothetical protein